MFTGNVMLMPGQELREFVVEAPETRETTEGRVVINGYVQLGTIRAILAQANPEETNRWRQLNHWVSHKIIMQHRPPFEVKSGYKFRRVDNGQEFYVTTLPYEPGGIGHWTIFYCNDRRDVGN